MLEYFITYTQFTLQCSFASLTAEAAPVIIAAKIQPKAHKYHPIE